MCSPPPVPAVNHNPLFGPDEEILPDSTLIPLPVTVNEPLITALPVYGNVVAVTPVNPDPSPLNDPVKEPVNGAVNDVN